MPDADKTALHHLEESLWHPETRYDLAHQERVFATECFEFGRSGKRYTRAEMISGSGRPFQAVLSDLEVRLLSSDVALVTYLSALTAEAGPELSNRSSIWVRSGATWQLHFHQGTPVAA